MNNDDYFYSFNLCKMQMNLLFENEIAIYRFCSHKCFMVGFYHNTEELRTSILQIKNSKEYSREIQKIFTIGENGTPNTRSLYGDWDDLLVYLKEKYQEIPENRVEYYSLSEQTNKLLSFPSEDKICEFIITLKKIKKIENCYETILFKIVKYIIEKSNSKELILPNKRIDMLTLLIHYIIKTNYEKYSVMKYIINVILNNDYKQYVKFSNISRISILRSLLEYTDCFEQKDYPKIFDCLYALSMTLKDISPETEMYIDIKTKNLQIDRSIYGWFDNELIERKNWQVYFVLKLMNIPCVSIKVFFHNVEEKLSELLGNKIVSYVKILLNFTEYFDTFGFDLLSETAMRNKAANMLEITSDALEAQIDFFTNIG